METSFFTLNVADVVELERRVAEAGTPLYALMENAGAAVARAVREQVPSGGAIVVLAGAGNNGGDGWVAAKLLTNEGSQVTIATPKAAEGLTAEPARSAALDAIRGTTLLQVLVSPTNEQVEEALSGADVVIDALLGTGFSGDTVREPLASWIEAANAARRRGAYLVAADVPSGVSAQDGTAAQPHIQADETITMITAKPGLFRAAGIEAAGQVHVANICDLGPFMSYLKSHAVPCEKPTAKPSHSPENAR